MSTVGGHQSPPSQEPCQWIPHQTMSSRKSTTKRFPRSFVDQPDQRTICQRLPMPHQGSRRMILRDLEAVASKPGVPTERELPIEILRRVRRIEEQLGIGDRQEPEAFEHLNEPFGQAPRRLWEQPSDGAQSWGRGIGTGDGARGAARRFYTRKAFTRGRDRSTRGVNQA
jgi:hypothetical protein